MPKTKYKKRADGRYERKIQTNEYTASGRPKRIPVYGYTIAELEANVEELKKQLAKGAIIEDKKLTVAAYAAQWLKSYKSGQEFKTQEMYQLAINKHIIPALGSLKMCDVRQHHIAEFINAKANEKRKNGKLYSERTLRIILMTLKQIFTTAADNFIIMSNPAAKVKVYRKVQIPVDERPILTKRQETLFHKLIQNMFASGNEWQIKTALFMMAIYYIGARPEETRALNISDFYNTPGKVIINKAVVFQGRDPVLKGAKTEASIREVTVPDILMKAIDKYKPKNTTVLFPGTSGYLNKQEYREMYEFFDKYLNIIAGGNDKIRVIEKITPEMLRHTYITKLFEAGYSPKYVMQAAGHANIQTTMKYYVHLSETAREEHDKRLHEWDV